MKLLDLFSGIGGFSLGLERAGFETVAFCEIDPKCRHLLNHHWPKVPVYDDICALTAERLADDGIAVDAICGGFPCQDISFAGLGAGIDGSRSGLWSEYARLIRTLRPRVVIVENVSALASRGLGRVLGDLATFGYDAWWDCISAASFGFNHQRDRLWIVAYPHADSLRFQGFGVAPGGTWSQQQFEGLVQMALQSSVPTRSGGGVHDGLPGRSHRLHGLGNAVIPAIPEAIGKEVMKAFA